MDGSALPYLYSLLADLMLLLIGSIVQWRQRRGVLHFMLIWLFVDAGRCLLIILSAGNSGFLQRDTVVWSIRALWTVQTTLLVGAVIPFLKENVKFK